MFNNRGGFTEPCPTAVIPPYPFDFNWLSFITETLSPAAAPPAFLTASDIAEQKLSGVK